MMAMLRSGSELWSNFHDGLQSICYNEQPIQILIKNSSLYSGVVMVGFHGAIEKRSKIEPPYFYFRGVSDSVGIPLISISDPSMNLSDAFNLAWYIGHHAQPFLQKFLAGFLDEFILASGARLVLAGGSGGGFAALSTQSLMKQCSMTTSFVWNPQIYAYDYNDGCTKKYLESCFPARVHNIDLSAMRHSDLCALMKEVSLCEVGFHDAVDKCNRVIMINGYDQNHLRKHIRKYVSAESFEYIDHNTLQFGQCIVHVGEWGRGHIGPPKQTVMQILSVLMDGRAVTDALRSVSSCYSKGVLHYQSKPCFPSEIDINVFLLPRYILFQANIGNHFKGYQWQVKLIECRSGSVVASSGYVLGSNIDQVFFDVENIPNFKIFDFKAQVLLEDFFGVVASKDFILNKLVRQVKLIKCKW